MKLLVVGAGEMGRWFARTLADELADPPTVTFADTDAGAAAAAADELDGRVLSAEAEAEVEAEAAANERFDAVCFAVPIPALESAVSEYADRAERALVDVTGVMGPAVDAMAEAAPTLERVSLHPLFAPANGPGNVAVVADAPGPVTDRLRDGLSAAGNDLFETSAAEHDRAMETVQARAHAAVLAFGLAADEAPEEFQTPVSSALFDVLDQVTGNDPGVYSDIQSVFDGADDVAAAARALADADQETFAGLYRDAGRKSATAGDGVGDGDGIGDADEVGDGDGDRKVDADREADT